MEPNYAFARSMASKILKDYKLSEVPTDLSVLFKGLDLKYIGLNDIDDIDGAIIENGRHFSGWQRGNCAGYYELLETRREEENVCLTSS